MNAVEIEEAVTALAERPFEAADFPFAFLQAFGNKETTLKRLRSGASNASDIPDGVLQRSNIHLAACRPGEVDGTLKALRESPKTAQAKAKYVLATDGMDFQAEDLEAGTTVACEYADFPDHFGFFLPLAGITTIKEIAESAFDIRATGRLNRLYVELLKQNPEWESAERRHDMNHLMARLIFCFFAEDTDIFGRRRLFTSTVEQMTERDGSNAHEVIQALFRAMNTKHGDRADTPRWAAAFPYVNGGLFGDDPEVPRFSRIARAYLLHIGALDWTKINPDIFGSMIQAVAEDEERGTLGMHYTSVPNILKVLNPLFLDQLLAQLDVAGDNARMLLNLRRRLARIRVFDPACGSGNFLVIAYKQMREIEAAINRRRGEPDRKSDIPLTNFRGIELRDFPAEIARLALIIAEFQCDVVYRGPKLALAEFLPLDAQNWITCGNALRLDWLTVCPPTGTGVKLLADDLFQPPLDQTQIDFENEGGETYICGNPPYLGFTWQSPVQKDELKRIFEARTKSWKSLDYVAGWFMKAADYGTCTKAATAFVATNSICQGEQVPILWPLIFATGHEIAFAHTSFKWSNLASQNAGVTVSIVGLSKPAPSPRRLYSTGEDGKLLVKETEKLNAYLVSGPNLFVRPVSKRFDEVGRMEWGNKPTDGGYLILSSEQKREMASSFPQSKKFIRQYVGSQELVNGSLRWCIWINDSEKAEAEAIDPIIARMRKVAEYRASSPSAETRPAAQYPHRFRQIQSVATDRQILISGVSSENREYLPAELFSSDVIASNKTFAMYDVPIWNLAIVISRLHWVWIGTVCVRLEMRFSYGNTLGWNTFPIPKLTEQNKTDLTHCAEDILLAREAHFPATIADLYDPAKMPEDLRRAHERNDETVERVYIGRRFRNDTERLEKLFELYARMTTAKPATRAKKETVNA